jgi:hypothetical protein
MTTSQTLVDADVHEPLLPDYELDKSNAVGPLVSAFECVSKLFSRSRTHATESSADHQRASNRNQQRVFPRSMCFNIDADTLSSILSVLAPMPMCVWACPWVHPEGPMSQECYEFADAFNQGANGQAQELMAEKVLIEAR